MPDSSSQPIQNPTYPADYADCGARINEANIASYMWYIHVTVRVNAPDRLRHSLAHILGRATTTTAPLSPSYSAPFGFGHINIPGSSSSRSDGARTLACGDDVASAADRIDDLYDYMVLQHFSWSMLETLINTAPVEELARGYTSTLAGIPAHFREEFCCRLYCLLFSKYIVEWPQGIAVPEPAPGSIAAAAAAASAATSPGSEAVVSSTSSNTDATERRSSPILTPQEEDHDVDGEYKSRMDRAASSMDISLSDDEEDYFTCNNSILNSSEKYKNPAAPEPKSPGYQSTLGPATPWEDTPSPGYNPELARAAYFGTVSEPQPIQYRGNWGRMSSGSSRDDGTARGACAEAKSSGEGIGEYACSAAATDADAAAGEGTSNDDQRLPPASVISPPRHQRDQHQHYLQAPPRDATPQSRPASLLGSAHSRVDVSHTGSCCCPCRAREAWSHGVGAQR